MKKLQFFIIGFVVMVSQQMFGRQSNPERFTIPLSDPARPVFLKASLMAGSISVKGYAGKEVIVDVDVMTNKEDEDGDDDSRKRKGMRRIPNTSSGLSIEEESNDVMITKSGYGSNDLKLIVQVPVNCSMKLNVVNGGEIEVEGVTGDLDINNTNNSVKLLKISGTVVAHALNGNLLVTMTKVTPDKAMSFSSMNGEVDVTLPPDIKADVSLKSDMNGEIYSDFEIVMDRSKPKIEEKRDKKGRFQVNVDKVMRGTINGGGAEYTFKNFQGNIYIRKSK
jgi:hypothetical protein